MPGPGLSAGARLFLGRCINSPGRRSRTTHSRRLPPWKTSGLEENVRAEGPTRVDHLYSTKNKGPSSASGTNRQACRKIVRRVPAACSRFNGIVRV